jgi:hypothetical protein
LSGADEGVQVVVPAALALDERSARRLIERLARSPADVVAVAAPLEPIEPGSSAPTQAEWAALDPDGEVHPAEGRAVAAAMAIRSGVVHTVEARQVVVDHGTILVDPSTRTYDPLHDQADPADPAGPHARPPFRWRPVVVFLAGEEHPGETEAVCDLIDALVDLEVEARLAAPASERGPRRTRRCAPTRASWQTLAPDVAVALDATAAGWAESWCDHRGTVLVELDAALGAAVELVSWTIGQAQGRLRARIGPAVDPPELAALLNRLCSGPQPEPPEDPPPGSVWPEPAAPTSVVTIRTGADVESDAAAGREQKVRTVALTGAASDDGPRRAALADQLDAAGHRVQRVETDLQASGPGAVDVLVVDPSVSAAAVDAWRATAGPEAAVVLDLADVEPTDRDTDLTPTGDVADLARATGRVLVGQPEQAARWRGPQVRVQLAAPLMTRARIDELTAAGARRPTPPAPVVGWCLDGATGREDQAGAAQIRDTLIAWSATEPEARIEVVGPADAVAALLAGADDVPGAERLAIRRTPPDPGELAAWTVQLWSPPPTPPTWSSVVLEAAFAGVPTVTTAPVAGGDPELTLDPGAPDEAWIALLAALGDDTRRRRWSQQAQARAVALQGPGAADAAIARLLGWATARGRS